MKTRKLTALLLALCMLLSLSISAFAADDAVASGTIPDSKITWELDSKGWLTISEYPSTYDKATSSGKGISIYEYISKDVSQPNASYFATGPVMPDVTGNILYLVYSNYSFDANYNTINEINPTVSTAWQTTGPFAA